MILISTFPSDDFVGSVAFSELNHKLKLKSLVLYLFDLGVRNISDPIMTVRPFHLQTTLTPSLVRIPLADELLGTNQPQFLAISSLVIDSNANSRKIDDLLDTFVLNPSCFLTEVHLGLNALTRKN